MVPRSSTDLKFKVDVANSPGTIDVGYSGGLGIILRSYNPDTTWIDSDKAVAQIGTDFNASWYFINHPQAIDPEGESPDRVSNFIKGLHQLYGVSRYRRGEGGFGSTG